MIIPNYNHEKYIKNRILSVLNQTFQDIELIILDDNSTDGSKDIIEQFRDHPKVSHIIYNSCNSGSTFRQWEKGFAYSKGEYIWIAESDDDCAPVFLESCLSHLENQPKVSLAFTDSKFIDGDGAEIIRKFSLLSSILEKYMYSWKMLDFKRLVSRMLFRNIVINASAVVFRRRLLNQVESCDKYRYCGDWLFWCSLVRGGNILFVDQKLNFFRQHLNKVTPKAEKEGVDLMEGLDVYNKILKMCNVSKFYHYSSLGSFYFIWWRKKYNSSEKKKKIYGMWKKIYPYVPIYMSCYVVYVGWVAVFNLFGSLKSGKDIC